MNLEEFSDHMWKFNNYGITLTAICMGNELGLFNLLMQEKTPVTSEELADRANMKERAVCLGKELGLFNLLMQEKTPVTSKELADRANMKERYVREWLGCMVAAQIIKLENQKYFIPPDRHDIIKGTTAWGYAAVSWVKRFDQTKACFQKDGPWGNDYDSDDSFWSFFGGFRAATGHGFLENTILPTLEKDFQRRLESGGQILDLGCGSGKFSISLAQTYPKASITGLDACDKPLKIAKDSLQKNDLSNVTFIKGDAHNLDKDLKKKFDLVFLCDCLHDLPDPSKALQEIVKVLKDDGKLVIIEVRPHSNQAENVGDMTAAMFYSCSMFSCLQCSMMVKPRIGYGACWGQEDMTRTIKDVFLIEKNVELPMLHAIYICIKK